MKEKEGRQAYIVMALIWDTRIIRYLDCNVTERQEWWYFPLTDSCQYCLFFGLNPFDYSNNPMLATYLEVQVFLICFTFKEHYPKMYK